MSHQRASAPRRNGNAASRRLSGNGVGRRKALRRAPTTIAQATIITPPLLRAKAYEAIKNLIITCKLKPGEALNEGHVCKLLKLGRTPVHQAFERLSIEGLVTVLPRKGIVVAPLNLFDILHIIEARLINESQCVRLAASRAEDADVRELEEILRKGTMATQHRDVERLMLLDRDFHMILARACKNEVISEILLRLHERSLRFWFLSLTHHHREVLNEHQAILDAIKQRDADAAETCMRAHIESFRNTVTRHL